MTNANQSSSGLRISSTKKLLVLFSASILGFLPLQSALAAGPTPDFSIRAAGPTVSGLATPQEVAEVLLDAGVSLAPGSEVRINTLAADRLPTVAGPLQSFGSFSNGSAMLGIDSGIIMTANAGAASFSTPAPVDGIAAPRRFNLEDADVTAQKI